MNPFLQKRENTGWGHVFRSFNRLKSDEGNVHRHQLADAVESRVRDVELAFVSAHQQKTENVKRDQIDDVNVTEKNDKMRNRPVACLQKQAERQVFQSRAQKTGFWTGFFQGQTSDREAEKNL